MLFPYSNLLLMRDFRSNFKHFILMDWHDLFISPVIRFASWVILVICLLKERSVSNTTPISFYSLVSLISEKSIMYFSLGLFLPMYRTLHLFVLKLSCHFFNQSIIVFMAFCNMWWFLLDPYSFVSSANIFILFFIPFGRSLIKIKKRRGPRKVLCGIPLVTLQGLDKVSFILTLWSLSVKKAFIHMSNFPVIFKDCILWRSLTCGTVSKALLKSK